MPKKTRKKKKGKKIKKRKPTKKKKKVSRKTKKAIEQYLELYPKNRTLVVAGGVAANKQIRNTLKRLCQEENFKN